MIRIALAVSCAAALGGCMSDSGRIDGVTIGAGNAIAANTVMQMVDPWQPGVQDTDLVVPADRAAPQATAEDGASDSSDN